MICSYIYFIPECLNLDFHFEYIKTVALNVNVYRIFKDIWANTFEARNKAIGLSSFSLVHIKIKLTFSVPPIFRVRKNWSLAARPRSRPPTDYTNNSHKCKAHDPQLSAKLNLSYPRYWWPGPFLSGSDGQAKGWAGLTGTHGDEDTVSTPGQPVSHCQR